MATIGTIKIRHGSKPGEPSPIADLAKLDTIETEAEIYGALAVHHPPSDGARLIAPSLAMTARNWCVTHIASGLSVASFRTAKAARSFAKEASRAIDWGPTENDLTYFVAHPEEARKINDIGRKKRDW